MVKNMYECIAFVTLQVTSLRGHKVVDVACGSGDAHTLCVTDSGN